MKPFKDRSIDYSEPVEVYRNLHTGGLSIRQDGRVVAHTDPGEEIKIYDARMFVSDAGRERVRAEGRKNVHAWIKGTLFKGTDWARNALHPLMYNPYKYDTFVDGDTGEAVHESFFVILSERKAFYGKVV